MANRADKRKFHYIYKITRFDGKYYIGMHSTDDLEDGYFGSGQRLWKSVKYHGREKHSMEILEFLPSRAELKKRERELVNEVTLKDPECLNLCLGGNGGWDGVDHQKLWDNPERRAAASKRSKEYWQDPEYRNAVTEALKSRRLTEEQRDRRSVAVQDVWSKRTATEREQISSKISESCKGKSVWVGRTHSEESKKKMSEAAKNRKRGPLSQETKDKISLKAKERLNSKKEIPQ